MLEALCKNTEIYNFLNKFPKHNWRKCVESLVLFSVRKLTSHKGHTPDFETLMSLTGTHYEAPDQTVQNRIKHLKSQLSSFSEALCNVEHQAHPPNLYTERIYSEPSPRPTKRKVVAFKNEKPSKPKKKPPLMQPTMKFSSRRSQNDDKKKKVPDYLKNVESRIKQEVKKDIAMFNYKKEVSNEKELSRSNSATQFRPREESFVAPVEFLDREIQEPTTLPIEAASQVTKYIRPEQTQEIQDVIKIADEFLNSTNYVKGRRNTDPLSPTELYSKYLPPFNM